MKVFDGFKFGIGFALGALLTSGFIFLLVTAITKLVMIKTIA